MKYKHLFLILLMTIGLSSCYDNAPDGCHSPPISWSGIWVPAKEDPSGRKEYHFLEPLINDTARLTSVSWQSKPGEEAVSRQVREVSLCEIEGEIVWCEKYISSVGYVGMGTTGKYGFAVVKQLSDVAQFLQLGSLTDDPIKGGYEWKSAQVTDGIAAKIRRLRGTTEWASIFNFQAPATSGSYRKSNLAKLPEPPVGLAQLAEARVKRAEEKRPTIPEIFATANSGTSTGKTGIKGIDDIDAPTDATTPILTKPAIKNWRDATADGGWLFLRGAMNSNEDMAGALALVGLSDLVGYQLQAIKITLQNTAVDPAAVNGAQVRVSSGEGGQSYTLIGFGWMNGNKPVFSNTIRMNARSEAEVFGIYTAPKGFQGTKLSID